MRRAEREVKDINEIQRILTEAQVCRIALFDGSYPYIIPMCFGYDLDGDKLEIYLHSAAKGKKIDLIKANSHAAFEIDKLSRIVGGEAACSFTADYESITGAGSIDIISGIDKLTGLNLIMNKYDAGSKEHKYTEQMLNNVVILKLTADTFCCKAHNTEK